jgi:hypothetical protein
MLYTFVTLPFLGVSVGVASAEPIDPPAVYTDTPSVGRDDIPTTMLPIELGSSTVEFSDDQLIGFAQIEFSQNDYNIILRNTASSGDTRFNFFNVFLVADPDVTFDNYDGTVASGSATGLLAKFLIAEWEAGADLTFQVINSSARPFIEEPGVPNPGIGPLSSTYSVVASRAEAVPEPSSLALAGIASVGLLGYAWRRKKRKEKGTQLFLLDGGGR